MAACHARAAINRLDYPSRLVWARGVRLICRGGKDLKERLMGTPDEVALEAAKKLPDLLKALMAADSDASAQILGELYVMGPSITFAAASTLAMIIAKGQLGDKFGQNNPDVFFGPAFLTLDTGSIVDSTQVEQAVAYSGQIVAAVANNDIEMEQAIFESFASDGPEMVAHVLGQLAADATKALHKMFREEYPGDDS